MIATTTRMTTSVPRPIYTGIFSLGIATVGRPPWRGLLLRVKHALGLVDHFFDLLLDLTDLLLGLAGLTVSLTL